ncbi:tetratricopeptide repeat-containing sensor histidine kinase [Rufibacter sp. LB8]|uniref:tetratricopeptide repeat-containing sensor histidine kinase n=1 Tax=Rufibacter sp. LB8 TaxID=2777781 RepID=UPI00178C4B98|nr:tetratricopeptide repeat-containing sensor histidine kinase [Rufibacter sp. LB8]
MRLVSIFILALLCAGQLQAQQALVDSLQVQAAKAPTDSVKVVLLNQISEQYTKFDPEKAIVTAQQAEKLATKINFRAGKAAALNHQGVSYLHLSEYGKAMQFHTQALKLRQSLKDTTALVQSYVNLGNTHYRNNDIDKALATYQEGLVLAQKVQDKLGMSRIYNNMGSIYENREDYSQALKYFKQASVLKKELKDTKGYSVTLHHLGTISAAQGNHAQAIAYLNQALQLTRQLENKQGEMPILRSLAEAHLEKKEYTPALAAAQQGLAIARQVKSTLETALCADLVHEIQAKLGNYPEAYASLLTRTYATDTLHSHTRRELVAEAEARYEADKKELENQTLKLQRRQQDLQIEHQQQTQIWIALALGAALGFAFLLFLSWRRSKAHNLKLQVYNEQVLAKNKEIRRHQNEMAAQAAVVAQQRDELEKLNAFKSKIFSIISHDLRSPFASVQALFYLAENKTMTDQEFKHLFKLLGKDYENATNLLNNLLVWAKSQMAGGSVQWESVNLQQLSEETASLMANNAQLKQIRILNEVPAGLTVTTDRERLNFVIRNLVMNALKFTQPEGTIHISGSETQEYVQLLVRDTGQGISMKNKARLFTDQRFSTKGTFNEKGTGLGLLFSKELLEGVNGKITLESYEGQGSVFIVTLPKAKASVTQPTLAYS